MLGHIVFLQVTSRVAAAVHTGGIRDDYKQISITRRTISLEDVRHSVVLN